MSLANYSLQFTYSEVNYKASNSLNYNIECHLQDFFMVDNKLKYKRTEVKLLIIE